MYQFIQYLASIGKLVYNCEIYWIWSEYFMNVEELIKIIDGKLINPDADLSSEIKGGCGADLMSDVLASIQPEAVLLTGLTNPQVIRTDRKSVV
jgi:hypothetical protein